MHGNNVRDVFIAHVISDKWEHKKSQTNKQTHKQTDVENVKQSYGQLATCFAHSQLVKVGVELRMGLELGVNHKYLTLISTDLSYVSMEQSYFVLSSSVTSESVQ